MAESHRDEHEKRHGILKRPRVRAAMGVGALVAPILLVVPACGSSGSGCSNLSIPVSLDRRTDSQTVQDLLTGKATDQEVGKLKEALRAAVDAKPSDTSKDPIINDVFGNKAREPISVIVETLPEVGTSMVDKQQLATLGNEVVGLLRAKINEGGLGLVEAPSYDAADSSYNGTGVGLQSSDAVRLRLSVPCTPAPTSSSPSANAAGVPLTYADFLAETASMGRELALSGV